MILSVLEYLPTMQKSVGSIHSCIEGKKMSSGSEFRGEEKRVKEENSDLKDTSQLGKENNM